MVTRSKSKTCPEIQKKPVRLTEDLLYIVNKKLKKIDSSLRVGRINKEFRSQLDLKEISYRRLPKTNLSQECLAVMHRVYFNSSSTAKLAYQTMEDFKQGLDDLPYCDEFMSIHRIEIETEVTRPDLFRFLTLPADYCRPSLGFDFFEELSWTEDGSIMLEASKLNRWWFLIEITTWLVLPQEEYPRYCGADRSEVCECRDIYTALWCSDIFRKLFEEEEIDGPLSIKSANQLVATDNMTAACELVDNMIDVGDALMKFVGKLARTEVVIHQSSQLNMFAAFQLKMLAEKLEIAAACQSRYADYWPDV